MDLGEIRRMENNPGEYWKGRSMQMWRCYIRNLKMVRMLRKRNRQLNKLLSELMDGA